jgi:uncharacterized membrane protein HdeD (DUF308 family)
MPEENQIMMVDVANVLGDLKKNWGWLLALGILLLILGFIGLGMEIALTIASVLFLGVLLLIGAVAQIIHAFKGKGWKSIGLHVLNAILYGVAGIIMLINPLLASIVFTLALGFIILVVGIMRIVMAFHIKGMKGWAWPLIGGIISIILGLLIIAQWPISGFWVIGLFVAIEMIVSGWSYIFVALAARHAVTAGSLPAQDTRTAAP